MKLNNSIASQRGTVIITVLMLVAVATYLAVEMTYRQRIDITRTGTLLALSQSEEYVKSAEALAQYVLEQDLISDIKSNEFTDHMGEDWPTKVVKPIGRGLVQGEIFDLEGRFNLNLLRSSNTQIQTLASEQLEQLLLGVGIPSNSSSNTSALSVANRIEDWVDEGGTPEIDGLESQDYLLFDPPYQTSNRVLVDLSELMLISGLSIDDLNLLAEHVALLPPQARLNINTASDTVLALTPCLDISAINAQRTQGDITDSELNVLDAGGGPYVISGCTPAIVQGYFSVKSRFFLLDAKSEVDKKTIHMHSVLYRPETTTAADVKVKVILRKHLDPFSGV